MSYQEPDEDDEVEADAEVVEEFADEPWQAPYAWAIVTGHVDVPDSVHAAAVSWLVGAFSEPQ